MIEALASHFIVASESHLWTDADETADLLRSQRLFKTLSLLLAKAAGVKVPRSLLLLGKRRDLIAKLAQSWHRPLMIRLDYRQSPNPKPLGGIPLYTVDAMYGVCKYLLSRKCLPLFHPNFDRFQDVYSAGVSLTSDDYAAEIEVVGQGFDAGDLRLGKATPHERVAVDLSSGTPKRRITISDTDYRRDRSVRAETAGKLRAYTDFANRSARLATSLRAFKPAPKAPESQFRIPAKYERMPTTLLRKLVDIAQTIRLSVMPNLPSSKAYVASLSYLPEEGWMLWDVYGDWYRR